jgi:Ca-activated chloride channel family protein
MRTRVLAMLLPALLGPGGQAPPLQPQTPQFRSGVHTVEIYPTVHDRDGRLVPNLTRDEFEILDNGQPAPITVFSNQIHPITVTMLLDMSGSMLPRFLAVREGALSFIHALLPHDRVRIGTFGFEIALSPVLTGNQATLTRIVREELWPGGPSPVWNAAHAAIHSLAGEPGRRVVLVVSDGQDTGSLPSLSAGLAEVRSAAIREGVMFYAVGLSGLLGPELRSLVEETGGGSFTTRPDEDLEEAFARVAEELRRQYVLGFSPAVMDGRQHRIEVRVGPGMKARARRSYIAR